MKWVKLDLGVCLARLDLQEEEVVGVSEDLLDHLGLLGNLGLQELEECLVLMGLLDQRAN